MFKIKLFLIDLQTPQKENKNGMLIVLLAKEIQMLGTLVK
jgi:hypothetical protein